MTLIRRTTRPLPLLNSLRSNDEMKDDIVNTKYGMISKPIYDAIQSKPDWQKQEVLKEIVIIARYLQDQLKAEGLDLQALKNQGPGKVQVIPASPPTPKQNLNFGIDNFPDWVLDYIHTENVTPLRELTQEQADAQHDVVVAIVIDVANNGKIRWIFHNNQSKTGYAFTNTDLMGRFKPGQRWLFQTNGGSGIDCELIGGVLLEPEKAERAAYTLAQTWRRYH